MKETFMPCALFISSVLWMKEPIKLEFFVMTVDVTKLHNVVIFKSTKIKIAEEQPMLLKK
jgi:hypothetical protein